jgi:hypothetical protein
MPNNVVLTTLLAKARALSGPLVSLALFAAAAGWALRGTVADADQLRRQVAALDSNTVKKEDLRLLQRDVRDTRILAESTNALLRRVVCRIYPRDICP